MGGEIFRYSANRIGGIVFRKPSFDFVFRAAMVLAIAIAYAPSSRHPPRADQWCFLNDMVSHHEVIDAVQSSYSYNRTRETLAGDSDLFRPVLFATLAIERALFEGNLRYTQMIGVGLHCCVCLLLFSLLRRIERLVRFGRQTENDRDSPPSTSSFLTYAITAFFALSPTIVEMVIWSHIHGYLLFTALMLGSANLLLQHISSSRAGDFLCPKLWGAWGLALVSAFTYELGQLYAVLVGLFLAADVLRRRAVIRAGVMLLAFAGVMFIYQAANKHDMRAHRSHYSPDNLFQAIRNKALTENTIEHSVRFTLYTNVQPFCPSILRFWTSGDRLNVNEALWWDLILLQERFGIRDAAFTGLFVLFASFGLVGLWGLLRRGDRLPLLILLLLFGTLGAYASMNILGRMNLRPGNACLSSNSYYTYIALLLGLTIWSTLMHGVPKLKGYLTTALWNAMLVGLVALVLHGAVQVRLVNTRLANMMLGMTAPIKAVHKFVHQHSHEQNFSIAIDYQSSDPVPKRFDKYVTDMIFYRWINPNAKYRIAIRHRAAVIVSVHPPEKLVSATP
jgi:hypothetical protein